MIYSLGDTIVLPMIVLRDLLKNIQSLFCQISFSSKVAFLDVEFLKVYEVYIVGLQEAFWAFICCIRLELKTNSQTMTQ